MILRKRKGQVLLIAVMLLATVITVVMTIAFNTTTETQVARLEADSQKALAAAEAGIDAVIKQSINTTPFDIGSLQQFSSQKITGNAQVVGVTQNYFVTPLLQKDEQYTFYLSDYPGFGNPWSGNITIYLASEGGCPSIEVTVIKNTYEQDRYAYDTCSPAPGIIINAPLTTDLSASPKIIDSTNFSHKTSAPITITNGIVAFIKVLNVRTKLGFEGDSSFRIQGKTVESEARTQSGVVKKVQLFQSYPQIPSNFFMTGF
jgi:hypothetical protein